MLCNISWLFIAFKVKGKQKNKMGQNLFALFYWLQMTSHDKSADFIIKSVGGSLVSPASLVVIINKIKSQYVAGDAKLRLKLRAESSKLKTLKLDQCC